jgi:hypothetical protein
MHKDAPRGFTSLGTGEVVEVQILSDEGIKAQCGFVENSTDFAIGTNGTAAAASHGPPGPSALSATITAPVPAVAMGPFFHVTPMGTGCASRYHCAGRGACDYCLQRCECYEGYGGLPNLDSADNQNIIIPPLGVRGDCTDRTCPFAPATRPLMTSTALTQHRAAYPATSPTAFRVDRAHGYVMECAGNGVCDRATGSVTAPPCPHVRPAS